MSIFPRCRNCGRRVLLPVSRGDDPLNCHLAFGEDGDPVLGCSLSNADIVTRTLVTQFFLEWSREASGSSDRLSNVGSHRMSKESES